MDLGIHKKGKHSDIDETYLKPPVKKHNGNDPHFAVGRQIHANTYYYEKYYFQLQERCEQMAEKLAYALSSPNFPTNDFTLLGLGIHCGQFLSETVNRLKQNIISDEEKKINYAVIDNPDKIYSFLFTPQFNSTIVIILPFTFTFSRCFEIIDYLKNQPHEDLPNAANLNICKQFISLFIVADANLNLEQFKSNQHKLEISKISLKGTHQPDSLPYLSDLYSGFGWDFIDKNGITFIQKGKYKGYSATYIHYLDATLYPAENCNYCFPYIDPRQELPLFPTRSQYDKPNVIFDLPKFKNSVGEISDATFSDVFEDFDDSGHLYGHLKLESNSYLHYIERDRFYINNKENILNFFKEKFKQSFPNLENKGEQLLIITPILPKSSTILEDMINYGIFPKESTFIIHTDPANEFIENFLSKNPDELRGYTTVLFFDYLISGGKVLKIISDYLKSIRDEGFSGMFTLIDRTTEYSKDEIIRKLTLNKKDENQTKRFISFFKLNIPLLDATNSGNPIEEKNARLVSMFNYCHLDGLKIAISTELQRGQPKNLNELKLLNKQYDLEDKQIRKRNLLKLKISHELASLLQDFKSKDDLDINFIIEEILSVVNVNGQEDEELIKRIIIKILVYPPFKFYEKIYFSVFKFVKNTLCDMVYEFEEKDYKLQDHNELLSYRFYLKMSVFLNGNFLFSDLYFKTLRGVYEQKINSVNGLLYNVSDLLILFKQSIFQSAARTIKLESQLNKLEFLPKPILYSSIPINDTLNDPFYLIGRLIKAENTFILDELKKHFLSAIYSDRTFLVNDDNMVNIRNYIQRTYFSTESDKTDRVIRNLQNFIKMSREKNDLSENGLPSLIVKSVEQMLVTIYRLQTSNVQPKNFLNEARDIIREACVIIGEDVEFSFCIEFSEVKASIMFSEKNESNKYNNMYIISSNPERESKYIRKQGLINHMLYGLNELSGKNLQTFLAVIKDESGKYISFRNDYVPADIQVQNSVKNVLIHDAFSLDVIDGNEGVIPGNVGMSLLIRFAGMEVGNTNSTIGKAVLVITTKKKATTKSLTQFIHVERIRLLLLIKEQMVEYLNRQFENEAFIELIAEKANIEKARLMSHGVNNYFKAADAYLNQNLNFPNADKDVFNFILLTLKRHFHSMLDMADGDTAIHPSRYSTFNYSETALRDLFFAIMKAPYLASGKMEDDVENWELEININQPIICEPVVFKQVLPELFVNMRRAARLSIVQKKIFSIKLVDNKLILENPYYPSRSTSINTIKPKGGREMCNVVLRKHGYEEIEYFELPTVVRVRAVLNLNRNNL